MELQTSVNTNPPTGLPVPQVLYLPLDLIDESASNPRKRFDDLAELAASIRDHGVETPIRVAPRGERYTLIGGARRLRASRLAGKTDIPVIVEEADDHQLLMRQLEDNANREDPHPLEEALAYQRALQDGWRVKDLSARLGKPASTIYSALKMCELIPDAQELFFAGKLNAGHAVEIARLSERYQRLALDYCHPTWDADREVTVRQLRSWIRSNCYLLLDEAAFDPEDAALLPVVGACTSCPKRSGANPELFSDIEDPNTCTDPTCFGAKDLAFEERRARERAAQAPPPPPEPEPEAPKPAPKPKAAKPDPEERKREAEAQRKREEEAKAWQAKREEEARKEREKERREELIRAKTLDAVLEKITWPLAEADFRALFSFLVPLFESPNQLADKFAIPKTRSYRGLDLGAAVPKLSTAKLARMAIAGMLLDLEFTEVGDKRAEELNRFAKRYQIDQAAIRKAVDAELNPKPVEEKTRQNVIGKLPAMATPEKPVPTSGAGTLTLEARKRIAEAQKKRWAEHKHQQAAKTAPQGKAAKKKGGKK